MAKPVVAIVGRPNVGKSTLFNRLVGRVVAIVSKRSGTTRDRVMLETVWADYPFILVDTGGMETLPDSDLWRQIRTQAETAIEDADIIVMVADVTAGVTASDMDVADVLRPSGKPIVLAVNKVDTDAKAGGAHEFHELGLGDPYPISGYHNLGLDDMMAEVIDSFPPEPEFPEPDADVRLAIVGRPNVGKSMLLNALTGENRSIVSDIPGTTRDTIDTLIKHNARDVLLIDTAGIRRRGKIGTGVEKYSVIRSVRAIDRADVTVLLMDAMEPATAQDTHVASYVLDAYKGLVLGVNKWDLMEGTGVSKGEIEALPGGPVQVRRLRTRAFHLGAQRDRPRRPAGHRALSFRPVDEGRAPLRPPPHHDERHRRAPTARSQRTEPQDIQRGAGQGRSTQLHVLCQSHRYGPFLIPEILGKQSQTGVRFPRQSAEDSLQRA